MNRRALLIGAGAAFGILVLWYFLLWGPRTSAVSAAAERADVAEANVEQLNLQLRRLKAAQKDEPLKRARLERLRTAIPDDPAVAQLILDVNDAANRSGIEFLSIAPGLPAAAVGGGPAQMGLSISITGGYFQVLDFLNRLAALPRIVVVDGFTLGGSGTRMTAAITGRTFLSSTTGATTTPASPTTTVAGATTTTTAAGATTTTTRP